MKIYLCITPFFPSETYFQGPYVLDQVKAIARNSDYRVIVVKPYSFLHREEDYEYDGVKVYRVKDYTLPSNIWPNAICDKFSLQSLIGKLKGLNIDLKDIAVCHCHVAAMGRYAVGLKKLNPDITTIVQHHGFDAMSVTDGRFAKFAWHKKLCSNYGAKICNFVDVNVGVSSATLGCVEQVAGMHLKRKVVLYNGVDTRKFYPDNKCVNNNIFTIGCVANFWHLKGHMTLIKAVERLVHRGQDRIKIIFIGSGYTKQECQDYIEEHGLRQYFEFRNEVDHKLLPEFYRSLDLFVLPSYWEAFGCVYAEAYSCGVPFIGVKGQGISEIVDAGSRNRWLIDKNDDVRLAELIELSINGNQPIQKLNLSLDINVLISQFLKNIN